MRVTSSSAHRRRLPRIAVASVALFLLAGACSGESDGARSGGDAAAVAESVDGGDVVGVADAAVADEQTTSGGVDLVAAAEGRQIISSATVSLTADDADGVVASISDLIEEAGGFIAGQNTNRVGGTSTTIELKVPPAEFDRVLAELADLGELRSQTIETDEVTEQVVDLESRISSAEASVVRLRELLDRSGSVVDIAQVETELLDRETTLETLRGQLRTIEQQVALASISVSIDSEDPAPVVEDDEDLPTFLSGLGAGWGALVVTLSALAAMLGALLPWAIVAAVVGVPVWRLARSRRHRDGAAPPPPPVPAAG